MASYKPLIILGSALRATLRPSKGAITQRSDRQGSGALTVRACEDCLVPKSLFKRMAVDEIEAAGHTPPNLVIAYPADARRQQS